MRISDWSSDVCSSDLVSAPWLNRVLEGRPRSIVRAVDGVNFSINKGETFSLVGESGCGKSTVARLIVGLYEPSAGSVNFEGYEVGPLTERKKHRDIQEIGSAHV